MRSAHMGPLTKVTPEEFFARFGNDIGLGPKDEMRFVERRPYRGPMGVVYPSLPVTASYRQYHDGYPAGACGLDLHKDGTVSSFLCGIVPGLPDAPRSVITQERAQEIAVDEVVRQTGRDRAEWTIFKTETPGWATARNPATAPGSDYRIIIECYVNNRVKRLPFLVEIDAGTGEPLQAFIWNEGE